MNTEITGNIAGKTRGWIFYDGDCAFCVRAATRWGAVFARRGFRWLPMQTPGTAASLGLSEAAVRTEMTLRLADGRVRGGVEAWVILFRAVWWMWPLGGLIGLPGLRTLSGAVYRWIARHRYCISGAGGLRRHSPSHHRHAAFLEMP